jgi:hypothetical protein
MLIVQRDNQRLYVPIELARLDDLGEFPDAEPAPAALPALPDFP